MKKFSAFCAAMAIATLSIADNPCGVKCTRQIVAEAISQNNSNASPVIGSNLTTTEGGVVACTTATGGIRNLNAHTSDNSAGIVWSSKASDPTGATNEKNGNINTSTVQNGTYPDVSGAIFTCANFQIDSSGNTPCSSGTCYDDWHLPSIGELSCLHQNLFNIGGFDINATYWSSTETSATSSFQIEFRRGTVFDDNKTQNYKTRCVRAFNP